MLRLAELRDGTIGGSSTPRLVGRDEPLGVIDAAVAEALSGAFRVVLVTGAGGVGKSRLAAEVIARHEHAAVCLSARSYRWGTTASFGPWIEALDRHLRRRPAEEVRRLCGASLAELATLLTTVEGAAATSDGTASAPQRWRLLEALVDLFDNLSADRPVLVALDDVHLADASSWEALRYLGRRLSDAPVAVVATARPSGLRAQEVAGEVLVGLDDDGLLTTVDLQPLARSDVADLVREMVRTDAGTPLPAVPEGLVTWLMSRTLGHPLFVVTLLRALAREGGDLADPHLAGIPESLRDRVSLELGHLDPEDREVLDVLAVLDHRIDLAALGRIMGREPGRLGTPLQRLSRSMLVTEHGEGHGLLYEVSHPIIQDTIYEGIGGARRRELHRRVARALMDAGQLGPAAGHFARSAPTGDDEAVDALCRAIEEAEGRSLHQEALAVLASLLEVLPAGDERWRDVLETMTPQSEWVVGHLAEGDAGTAIAAMRRIEEVLAPSDDREAQATVQVHLASFLSFGVGQLRDAEDACKRATRLFDGAGQPERALLARNELGWIRAGAGDLAGSATITSEVLDAALAGGHRRAAVHASGTRAYALGLLGRVDEAVAEYHRSIDLAITEGSSYRAAWGRTQLGFLLGLVGHLEEARTCVETALHEDPSAADALAHEVLAHCDWLAGDLEAGLDRLEQAVIRRPVRDSKRRAWGLALAARMQVEVDQPGRARRALEQAERGYGDGHFMAWSFWCDWTAGVLAWREGRLGDAGRRLERTADRLRSIGAAVHEPVALLDVIERAVEAHEPTIAAAAADRLRVVAASIGGRHQEALASLGAAWSHLAHGRDREAAAAAEGAADQLEAAGWTFWLADARAALGRGFEGHDRAAAVEATEQAAELFDRCGAVWRRDRVLDRLRSLGTRGRRAAAAVQGPEALTGREREVARLAARGHTAREIGERLFIGTRTVESHLASTYAKLGLSSKRELVRRADDLDL
jgi:ATP/maltotriose-dependent transcriptional regulator MalT